jgi:hypothetical protein
VDHERRDRLDCCAGKSRDAPHRPAGRKAAAQDGRRPKREVLLLTGIAASLVVAFQTASRLPFLRGYSVKEHALASERLAA